MRWARHRAVCRWPRRSPSSAGGACSSRSDLAVRNDSTDASPPPDEDSDEPSVTGRTGGAGTSRLRRTLYPAALTWYSREGATSRGRAYRPSRADRSGRPAVFSATAASPSLSSAGGPLWRFPPGPPSSPSARPPRDAALGPRFGPLPSRMSSSAEFRLVRAASTSRRSSSAVVAVPGPGGPAGEASPPSGVERPVERPDWEVAIDRADAETARARPSAPRLAGCFPSTAPPASCNVPSSSPPTLSFPAAAG
mmetsp:Transcript_31378/g.74878  ORF Transcript_31378/g.74878 Transcript_31378/m.74878 type:complete len:252 (-) Transcript_31378:36-791(-)